MTNEIDQNAGIIVHATRVLDYHLREARDAIDFYTKGNPERQREVLGATLEERGIPKRTFPLSYDAPINDFEVFSAISGLQGAIERFELDVSRDNPLAKEARKIYETGKIISEKM